MDDREVGTDVLLRESAWGGITPAVQWLIVANVSVFFLQVVVFGTENTAAWLGLSSAAFPEQWWSVLTYMFVHAGVLHIAMNMFMLWMFGPRVERDFGTRSFSYFYFWCGLGGAAFQLLFVRDGAVIGASGAVVGVVLAYALRWPDEELYLLGVIPMRARWLAVWMIVWNVGMALAGMTSYGVDMGTAWMAHVGGMVFACLYLYVPTGASLERIRRHVATVPDETGIHPIPNLARAPRGGRRARREAAIDEPSSVFVSDDIVAESRAVMKQRTPRGIRSRRRMEALDRLLDKISHGGIGSLTMAERRVLEDLSRRMRE